MTDGAWRGRRVLVTGHTGFKGAWLSLLLDHLGADVAGYALEPPTTPSLFELARVEDVLVAHHTADVRDPDRLAATLQDVRPDVVLHLAAQPLVRRSYRDPVGTYTTNVLGTLHLLEAVRRTPSVRAAVVVTSDKCYRNDGSATAFTESDPLGGSDPYSASKAAAELIVASHTASYFSDGDSATVPLVASARAGNVIGGGDWADDRLVPDLIRGLGAQTTVPIRYPDAVRPWQHVLEPLSGYLTLAERLLAGDREAVGAWNFGPRPADAVPVHRIADHVVEHWGGGSGWMHVGSDRMPEATTLRLDWSRAAEVLGWQPAWDVEEAVQRTVAWYRAAADGADARKLTLHDIEEHLTRARQSRRPMPEEDR